MSNLVLLFVRGALVLALALVAIRLARRSAASLRYTILAAAFAAVLALPVIGMLVPSWHTGAIAEPAYVKPATPVAEEAGPAVTFSGGVAPSNVTSASAPIPWGMIASGIWLAGVAALLLRIGVGAGRARGIARRGERVHNAIIAETWRAVGGRGAAPRVVRSAEVDAPIVVGAVAPVVVVPRASSEWGAERWRVVLLHELAHVCRRDGISNLIAQLACAIHWIDPLAWLAARRMRNERELAADDAVLRGGARASTYAEHLVAIATASTHTPMSVLAMAAPSSFESRVVALLDGDRSRRPAGMRAVAIVAVTIAVAVFTACVSPDAPRNDVTPPTKPVTNDPALQIAAEAELDRAIAAHHAHGAIAIVLDAKSGAPLALVTRGDANAAVARPPGSTLKPFTFAAALEANVVDANTRLDCSGTRKYGDHTMTDASQHGLLDLGGILAVSSNVCTARIAEMLDGDRFAASLRRYHLDAPSHIDTHGFQGAAIAAGEGIQVSALDLASAYTAIADGGMFHARDGVTSERVMSESAAHTLLSLLERPVNDPDGTARAARIEGVRVAGKTGTVDSTGGYYASFVAIVPADAPRFVVLAGVDGADAQGGKVAAPIVAKLAAQALAH